MNVHLWRYLENQRNYPGYHMSADHEGCLALLEWLRGTIKPRELKLQPLTPKVLGVPNNSSAAHVGCTSLKLSVKPDADSGHFLLSEMAGRLTIECSPQQWERLRKGVEGIMRGDGDYCIGEAPENSLWFWWYPK